MVAETVSLGKVFFGGRGRRVAIIGAGVGGLTAGFELAKSGYAVTVLEKSSQVGGLAKTVVDGDFRFDLGTHRWYATDENLNRFFREICGEAVIEVPRVTRILFGGHFFSMPIRIGEILDRFGAGTALRCALSFVRARLLAWLRPRHDTVEEAYTEQFGRRVFKLFFEKYTAKLWGVPCSGLSGEWVNIRANGLNLATNLAQAVFRRFEKQGRASGAIDSFLYPKLGIGQFSELLAKRVESLGGKVFLGASVDLITPVVSGGFQIQAGEGHAPGGFFDAVVSTAPLTDLVRRLRAPITAEVAQAINELTYRDMVVISLFLDNPSVTKDTWVYTQDESVIFTRFHEPRNWSPAMSPAGKTSVVLECPCWEGDALWRSSDAELVARGAHDFGSVLGLADPRCIIGGRVVRVPKAYPIYKVGFRGHLRVVESFLKSWPGLYFIGRSGAFVYESMAHPVSSGMKVAAAIAASLP